MNEPRTIDVPSEVTEPMPQQALTVRDAVTALEPVPPQAQAKVVTAAQAKVEAVANLTAAAYSKASELHLTPEESKALQADFPDEAFKSGAAGKENLIYIEHAFLRDRLNQVIGLGQWALIPRSRWAEEYRTQKGTPASRVYVEAMLMVRGCFVSEAVGEMEYYPGNAAQNYGDAVEGAKTAALRRCCKEFGIGLQAWKKDWCMGWWDRKQSANRRQPLPPTQTAPATVPRPQAPAAAPRASTPTPGGEQVFPVVVVVSVKEVHSKPEALKPWTAYFVKFDDGLAPFEAATFDKKIAAIANELGNTQETATLTTRPGRKPDTREIVSLVRAEQPPTPEAPEDLSNAGMATETGELIP